MGRGPLCPGVAAVGGGRGAGETPGAKQGAGTAPGWGGQALRLRASEPGSEADAWSPETLLLQSADPHLQSGARGG